MEYPDIQQLQREVRELRADVRRVKHLIEGAVLIVTIGVVALFPSLLAVAIALAVFILFGFLVSPLHRTIFQSLFQKERTDELDSQRAHYSGRGDYASVPCRRSSAPRR